LFEYSLPAYCHNRLHPRVRAERVTAAYTRSPLLTRRFGSPRIKASDKYGFDTRLIYMRGTVPTSRRWPTATISAIRRVAVHSYAAKGGDVVLLGCMANKVIDYVLIANPSISRIEQLRGKAIGISCVGDQTINTFAKFSNATASRSKKSAGANRLATETRRRSAPRIHRGEHSQPSQ
jgi:hypothetical protein